MILALLIMKDIFLWIMFAAMGLLVEMLVIALIDNNFKGDDNAKHKWTKVAWLSYRLYLALMAYLIVLLEICQ